MFSPGSPQTFLLAIPLAPTPVMVVGPGIRGSRYFAVSQNIANPTGVECNSSPTTQPLGEVTGIEISSYTTDTPSPVGKCPVYAVESPDSARVFVLNRGSDTVSVINAQNRHAGHLCLLRHGLRESGWANSISAIPPYRFQPLQ